MERRYVHELMHHFQKRLHLPAVIGIQRIYSGLMLTFTATPSKLSHIIPEYCLRHISGGFYPI